MSDNPFCGCRNSRGSNANYLTHHNPASTYPPTPSQRGSSEIPGRTEKSEPNFLDLALGESEEESEEESDEESDDDSDEWEEVMCTAGNTVVDRPLIAAPSGFTLPTRGKRSEFLTLEVVEDWQPPSHQPTSQDDSLEADLQLEAELAEALADLTTPVPGPPQPPRSRTPNTVGSTGTENVSPSTQPPAHLKLEVVERPPAAHTSTKGKGKMADRKLAEGPHRIGKRAVPLQVSSAINDQPTRKPRVSFKEKATEVARSTRRLLAPSKPLAPRNFSATPTLPTTAGPSSTPNNAPHPISTSDSQRSTPQLFTPKGFVECTRALRGRKMEETHQRFEKRYGGVIVEHARQDLVDSTTTGSSDAREDAQPTKKLRARKTTTGGKRITKAQAQAEEVMRICRTAKSYFVDLAAIKRRTAPTFPESQHPDPTIVSSSRTPSVRPEKTVPTVANQEVCKTRPAIPPPASQLLSTSFGSVPQGLKFTRKRKPVQEPGENPTEVVGRVSPPERDVCVSRSASAGRDIGPLMTDVSKRRREDLGREVEGASPRKRPRLGQR